MTIAFARATTISSRDVTSYKINRYSSPGATTPVVTFTCTWPSATTLSCADSGLPSGTWYYTDTPQIAGSLWIGAESPKSGGISDGHHGALRRLYPGYRRPRTATATTTPIRSTVSLSASDNLGGSGIASITYWIDAALQRQSTPRRQRYRSAATAYTTCTTRPPTTPETPATSRCSP